MKKELTMKFDKMTKGAVRYAEETNPDEEAILRTVYVRKSAFTGPSTELPKQINVTVEWKEAETV